MNPAKIYYTGLILFWMAIAVTRAPAAPPESPPSTTPPVPHISKETLDRKITETINQPEYRWRLPRQNDQENASSRNTFWIMVRDSIEKLLTKLGELMGKIYKWLDKYFGHKEKDLSSDNNFSWQTPIQFLTFVLIAITASVLTITLLRMWKKRKLTPQTVAQPVPVSPDITDENVTADQLPSDEWMNMARDLLAKGENRLALRAMFLATLVHLAYREKLTLAKHKSNREYLIELERRAHDRPDLLTAFSANLGVLESVWYGTHPATREMATDFTMNQNRIFGEAI